MFNFNKFVFGLKIDLDPSLIEPPLLLLYLVLPFFVFVCRVCCCFFLFHQGLIQTSLAILVKSRIIQKSRSSGIVILAGKFGTIGKN